MKIIASTAHEQALAGQNALELPNDADPMAADLTGITRIDLHFPKFTDGRAYSQARLLRQRRQFSGEIRATGDVLIDQLVHMARCGFDVAVLKEGVDAATLESIGYGETTPIASNRTKAGKAQNRRVEFKVAR